MKLDFGFACDQLNPTNHSLQLELSSSASCQHILTMCICRCTYMDTLPLSPLFCAKTFYPKPLIKIVPKNVAFSRIVRGANHSRKWRTRLIITSDYFVINLIFLVI